MKPYVCIYKIDRHPCKEIDEKLTAQQLFNIWFYLDYEAGKYPTISRFELSPLQKDAVPYYRALSYMRKSKGGRAEICTVANLWVNKWNILDAFLGVKEETAGVLLKDGDLEDFNKEEIELVFTKLGLMSEAIDLCSKGKIDNHSLKNARDSIFTLAGQREIDAAFIAEIFEGVRTVGELLQDLDMDNYRYIFYYSH